MMTRQAQNTDLLQSIIAGCARLQEHHLNDYEPFEALEQADEAVWSVVDGLDEEDPEPMPCGCSEYHMADCPLVAPPQLDEGYPDDYPEDW